MSQIPGQSSMVPGNGACNKPAPDQSNDTMPMFGGAYGSVPRQPSANINVAFKQDRKRRPRSYSRHRPSGGRHARYSSYSRSRSRSRGRHHRRRRDARSRSPYRESSYRHRHRGRSRSPIMNHQSRHSGGGGTDGLALQDAIAKRKRMENKFLDALAVKAQSTQNASIADTITANLTLENAHRDYALAMSDVFVKQGCDPVTWKVMDFQYLGLIQGRQAIALQQAEESIKVQHRLAVLERKIDGISKDVANILQRLTAKNDEGSNQTQHHDKAVSANSTGFLPG